MTTINKWLLLIAVVTSSIAYSQETPGTAGGSANAPQREQPARGGSEQTSAPRPVDESIHILNSGNEQDIQKYFGVKAADARKIIDARPYAAFDDLQRRHIVSRRTYKQMERHLGPR